MTTSLFPIVSIHWEPLKGRQPLYYKLSDKHNNYSRGVLSLTILQCCDFSNSLRANGYCECCNGAAIAGMWTQWVNNQESTTGLCWSLYHHSTSTLDDGNPNISDGDPIWGNDSILFLLQWGSPCQPDAGGADGHSSEWLWGATGSWKKLMK